MPKKERKQRSKPVFKSMNLWISVVFSLIVVLVYVFSQSEIGLFRQIGIFEIIEDKTLDMRFRWRGERAPGNDIVIVGVDEKTYDELGRWESSGRKWMATLLNILREGGAKVIGFDLTLAEADEGTALEVIKDVKKQYRAQAQGAASHLPEMLTYLDDLKATHDYDQQLAQAIQDAGNVILGLYHFWDTESASHLIPEQQETYRQLITRVKYSLTKFLLGTSPQPLRLPHSYGVEPNLALFSESAKSFGHFDFFSSRDGFIRYAPLLIEYMDDYYPSLDLEMVRTYLNDPLPIIHALGEEARFKLTTQSLEKLRNEGIPDKILEDLKPLEDQTFIGETKFRDAVKKHIGQDQTVRYKELILKHAREKTYGFVDSIQLGKLSILTDERARLLINFYGPGGTFRHYSLSDVVSRKLPAETFQDKIVLLGFTSKIDQDVHPTTFNPDGSYPGVEIHATVIENILRNDILTQPEWATGLDAFIILLLGVFLGIALHRMRPYSGMLTALICLIVVVGIAHGAFLFLKIWLNLTFPFLFILLDYLILTTYKYFSEEKKKKEVKNAFQHYVSAAVVDHMLETVDQLHLGGERRQMTALFTDIRGFTSISESMKPEDLVQFLNQYLTAMTKIVMKYDGTVDKYMGDAIMAFYGAPLEQPDHAVSACRTAVDMIAHLHQFQETQMYDTTWKSSASDKSLVSRLQEIKDLIEIWKARGLWPINIGIGINSGDMIVGNMGSDERFDYTIMGDQVNLASRLEGINKQYGTSIVISEFTYDIIKNKPFIVRKLDAVRVKGKLEPVTIYELMGYGPPDVQVQNLIKTFSDGLQAYKNRQWTQAIAAFQEILRQSPADHPSELYIKRCREYQQNPPPEQWDGVFVMTTK